MKGDKYDHSMTYHEEIEANSGQVSGQNFLDLQEIDPHNNTSLREKTETKTKHLLFPLTTVNKIALLHPVYKALSLCNFYKCSIQRLPRSGPPQIKATARAVSMTAKKCKIRNRD